MENGYSREKGERTTENWKYACQALPTKLEKYWTESGRGDGQGDVEKEDHQSSRRCYMMGKARGKKKIITSVMVIAMTDRAFLPRLASCHHVR